MSETPARNDTLPAAADDAALLADQVAYYRARAPEYDAWWFRTGRFDRGEQNNAAWRADVALVEQAVAAMLATTRPSTVLELACGTGLFTRHLAPRVAAVTAVDASPEVIAINRGRVAAANVRYVEADLFAFEPEARYDCVFMSFWLSHVPHARFDGVLVDGAARARAGRLRVPDRFRARSDVHRGEPSARPTGTRASSRAGWTTAASFASSRSSTSRRRSTRACANSDSGRRIAQTPRYFVYGVVRRDSERG